MNRVLLLPILSSFITSLLYPFFQFPLLSSFWGACFLSPYVNAFALWSTMSLEELLIVPPIVVRTRSLSLPQANMINLKQQSQSHRYHHWLYVVVPGKKHRHPPVSHMSRHTPRQREERQRKYQEYAVDTITRHKVIHHCMQLCYWVQVSVSSTVFTTTSAGNPNLHTTALTLVLPSRLIDGKPHMLYEKEKQQGEITKNPRSKNNDGMNLFCVRTLLLFSFIYSRYPSRYDTPVSAIDIADSSILPSRLNLPPPNRQARHALCMLAFIALYVYFEVLLLLYIPSVRSRDDVRL